MVTTNIYATLSIYLYKFVVLELQALISGKALNKSLTFCIFSVWSLTYTDYQEKFFTATKETFVNFWNNLFSSIFRKCYTKDLQATDGLGFLKMSWFLTGETYLQEIQ